MSISTFWGVMAWKCLSGDHFLLAWKSDLHFHFPASKVPFLGTWKGALLPKMAHFGYQKMVLRLPKSKFWDHFSIQTSPQNPQKHTLGTRIGPQKVFFGQKKTQKGVFSKSPNGPILKFCVVIPTTKVQIKTLSFGMVHFFYLKSASRPMCIHMIYFWQLRLQNEHV